ncbi:caskin-2 isoform X2 [Patella vulgata]|uniref:caskin-2 isoform X2 n=1 Tax=Patella vulgata TaxID=6465 RepID=UPI0024A921D1|nr:caskin-2 isoform X2 [Patella vulgata]
MGTCGIDVNRPNSYDQTALDIVNKFTTTKGAKELKHLLKEVSFAVQARAVKDYYSVYDPHSLAFKEGDIITVLEQRSDGIWKGYVVQEGRLAKTGYFPANHVVLVDSQALAKQNAMQQQSKRINMPQVPDLLNRSMIFNNSHDRGSYGSSSTDDSLPPPPSPGGGGYPNSPSRDVSYTGSSSPYSLHPQLIGGRVVANHTDHGEWSNYSMAGDMRGSSPAKESPANSNRNSAASSDSGRGFSTGHVEHKIPNIVNVQVNNQHRLSGQSYESGVSSRQSYHSTSSSSLGSLDRLEESGSTSNINVLELFQAGVPDHEVLHAWLHDLRYEEYYSNFQQAGYDMPTISRMTPEDLTAIGITKPAHRKRLKAEIARLNIPDGIPDFKPNDLMEWLHLLGLGQYYDTLVRQEYDDIEYVTGITWEDLEEIGIQRLGHQKKIILAIERLKRISSGSKRLSSVEHNRHGSTTELLEPPPPPGAGGRWSTDMAVSHELLGAIPKKSSSGESISTIGSGGSGETRLPPTKEIIEIGNNSNGYQPDVIAIQVNRNQSKTSTSSVDGAGEGLDMGGQPISYRSFQGTMPRKTSESGDVFIEPDHQSPVAIAPMAPKVAAKPKPVAKIIAKTKRSSHEMSPDFAELEKHESECNSDGKKLANQFPGSNSQYAGGTLKRSSKNNAYQKEHIYDTPHVSPPKAPKPLVLPKTNMEGPSSPLFIATNQEMTSQTPSPTGRSKKNPPPPPKRTNSIRDGPMNGADTSNKSSPVHQKTDQLQQVTQPAPPPKPQLTQSPVKQKPQALSPKPHLPQSPIKHQITPSKLTHTSVIQQQTPPPKPQLPQSPVYQQQSPVYQQAPPPKPQHSAIKNQQTAPEAQPQNFADCVKSLSERFGKKRDEEVAQDTLSSDGEDFPPPPPPIAMDIITPKIRNYGIPSKTEKSVPPEFVVQNKIKKDMSQSLHEKLSDRSFVGGQIRRHVSPGRDLVKSQGRDKMTDVEIIKANFCEKRSDSTSSFESTSSVSSGDSNTLPFANENVGTIKQRIGNVAKPSIVTSMDGMDGERNIDLNSGLFDESCSAQFIPHNNLMSRSAPVVPPKGVVRPSVPSHKPSLPNNINQQQQQQLQPPLSPKTSRNTETGDVLSDIDNMLQDLTEELDAMLVE